MQVRSLLAGLNYRITGSERNPTGVLLEIAGREIEIVPDGSAEVA